MENLNGGSPKADSFSKAELLAVNGGTPKTEPFSKTELLGVNGAE